MIWIWIHSVDLDPDPDSSVKNIEAGVWCDLRCCLLTIELLALLEVFRRSLIWIHSVDLDPDPDYFVKNIEAGVWCDLRCCLLTRVNNYVRGRKGDLDPDPFGLLDPDSF